MNQLSKGFDYTTLPCGMADYLKSKESLMKSAVSNAYTEVGKHLKEAQEELSKNGYGCFEEWYTSLGLNRGQVYRMIGRYELILTNCEKQQLIEDLPISLAYEISKPSAPKEAVRAVLDEEVTTHKEYINLKKSLQDAEKAREQAQSTARHYEKLWNQAKSKPPQTITKSVEVIPEQMKRQLDDLKFENQNLKAGYQDARRELEHYKIRNTVEFDELEAQKQRKKLQHEAELNALQIRVKINKFLEETAITAFMEGALAAADPITKKKIHESLDMLDKFTHQIKASLNGRIIGGVINE